MDITAAFLILYFVLFLLLAPYQLYSEAVAERSRLMETTARRERVQVVCNQLTDLALRGQDILRTHSFAHELSAWIIEVDEYVQLTLGASYLVRLRHGIEMGGLEALITAVDNSTLVRVRVGRLIEFTQELSSGQSSLPSA